jgi:hypothetical protein
MHEDWPASIGPRYQAARGLSNPRRACAWPATHAALEPHSSVVLSRRKCQGSLVKSRRRLELWSGPVIDWGPGPTASCRVRGTRGAWGRLRKLDATSSAGDDDWTTVGAALTDPDWIPRRSISATNRRFRSMAAMPA